MSPRVDAVCEAISGQLGSAWAPDGNLEVDDMLKSLPQVFSALGAAVAEMSTIVSENAVEPAVQDELDELSAHTMALEDVATQVYLTFCSVHEEDLARLQEPRPGEEMWDVTQNDGGS